MTISACAGTRTRLVRHLTISTGSAEQRAGDFHFVVIERSDRLRRQNAGGMHADHQRDLQRLAGLLGHAEIMPGVPRQQQDADTIRTAHLAAMNRDVLNAGLRISGDQQRRRDIGPAVVFVVLRDRQLPEQIDLAMNRRHAPAPPSPRPMAADGERRSGTGTAVRRWERRGESAIQLRSANRLATTGIVMLARLRKQHGALQFELLGHRRQFIDQRNTLARDHEPVGGDKPLQPAAQIGMRPAAVGGRPWPGVLASCSPSGFLRASSESGQEISSRLVGRVRNSGRSPQRLTTPTSISNRSSARPTV